MCTYVFQAVLDVSIRGSSVTQRKPLGCVRCVGVPGPKNIPYMENPQQPLLFIYFYFPYER